MAQTMNGKIVIIVTHSTRMFGPPYALADFLKVCGSDLLFIDHPLDYDPTRQSRLEIWQNGKKVELKLYPNWLPLRAVNYLKDFFVTVWILLRYARGRKITYYFGCDSLSCLSGLWLRPFLKFGTIVGYNTDYSTVRFNSPWLNALYMWADRYTMARVDKIWCVTQRIREVRISQRGDSDNIIVVPNGAYLSRVKAEGEHNKGLVFIGNLIPEKGNDILLKALAEVPRVKLTIYGDGPERPVLQQLAKKLYITDRVHFVGEKSNKHVLRSLVNYQAGVALYQPSQSYVYYSDPLKIKEYLAAGLPVIITDVPEIADVIANYRAGVVIRKQSELVKAIKIIAKSSPTMSQQACQLAKQFDWHTLFAAAFRAMTRTSLKE